MGSESAVLTEGEEVIPQLGSQEGEEDTWSVVQVYFFTSCVG